MSYLGANQRLSKLITRAREFSKPKAEFQEIVESFPGFVYSCKDSNSERVRGFEDAADALNGKNVERVSLEAGSLSKAIYVSDTEAFEAAILARWPEVIADGVHNS